MEDCGRIKAKIEVLSLQSDKERRKTSYTTFINKIIERQNF